MRKGMWRGMFLTKPGTMPTTANVTLKAPQSGHAPCSRSCNGWKRLVAFHRVYFTWLCVETVRFWTASRAVEESVEATAGGSLRGLACTHGLHGLGCGRCTTGLQPPRRDTGSLRRQRGRMLGQMQQANSMKSVVSTTPSHMPVNSPLRRTRFSGGPPCPATFNTWDTSQSSLELPFATPGSDAATAISILIRLDCVKVWSKSFLSQWAHVLKA